MAIDDYAGLKEAMQKWAARSDTTFSNQFDTFLSYAEDRIYNGAGKRGDALYSPALRNRTLETTATVAMASGVGALPDRHLATKRLYFDGDRVGLEYLPSERFSVRSAYSQGGDPQFYTIRDGSIYTFPATDEDLEIDYYQRLAPLTSDSASNTNDLLTNHEHVYLAAVLFEAFSFMQSPDKALAHLARLNSAIDGLNGVASATATQGASMHVRPRFPIP